MGEAYTVRILITNSGSRLSQELAAALSGSHEVTMTGPAETSSSTSFIRSDLGHDEGTNSLVRGMDAIVHSGETHPGASVSDRLDAAMRCTYNLLLAAGQERVPRFVFLSSLGLLDQYDEGLAVTERWRSRPTTEPAQLCYHLGEFVCREFARERQITVVCLRLGDLAWPTAGGGRTSSQALLLKDAIQAVEQAVSVQIVPSGGMTIARTWNVFHVQSEAPDARYLTGTAQEVLGYAPAKRE